MKKILIVEDDQAMAHALKYGFEYEGYATVTATDGADALRRVKEKGFDVIVLDVMLPKMSGLEVCEQLRGAGDQTPVIMLTAQGQEMDKVRGLRTGADDYVTKPFSFLELLARVEVQLRHAGKSAGRFERYAFGNVAVDFAKMTATKNGAPLELSHREFKLLECLVRQRGETVSREHLLDAVWGYEDFPLSRTVDMHIAKLRQKIEDEPSHPQFIITVPRMGYKFMA
jgi:DNA-binding response OmpR family regulator